MKKLILTLVCAAFACSLVSAYADDTKPAPTPAPAEKGCCPAGKEKKDADCKKDGACCKEKKAGECCKDKAKDAPKDSDKK